MQPLIKIIQITDTHIFQNKDMTLLGVDSNTHLLKVLDRIKQEDLDDCDFIFLTGDISQDHSVESYHWIANELRLLNKKIYWISGNHDDISSLGSVFSQYPCMMHDEELRYAGWRFLFVDTTTPGKDFGLISDMSIHNLKNQLKQINSHDNIVFVMHHHPAPVNTPLIDRYILKNNHLFWEIIRDIPTQFIMTGHVHGDYHYQDNHVTIHTGPATCLQWVKGATDLQIDHRIGYKIYYFYKNNFKTLTKLWNPHVDENSKKADCIFSKHEPQVSSHIR